MIQRKWIPNKSALNQAIKSIVRIVLYVKRSRRNTVENFALCFQCLSRIGKMWKMCSISHPSNKIDTRTAITAMSSPKAKPRRAGA